MIINKRHKRYSSILTILFFILVVTYTNIGYANNLVEIAGIVGNVESKDYQFPIL